MHAKLEQRRRAPRLCRGRLQTEHAFRCLILLVNHRLARPAYHNAGLGGGARSPSARRLGAATIVSTRPRADVVCASRQRHLQARGGRGHPRASRAADGGAAGGAGAEPGVQAFVNGVTARARAEGAGDVARAEVCHQDGVREVRERGGVVFPSPARRRGRGCLAGPAFLVLPFVNVMTIDAADCSRNQVDTGARRLVGSKMGPF